MYLFYHTMHPDGSTHDGSTIIIKNNIRHHVVEEFRENYLQVTNVVIED